MHSDIELFVIIFVGSGNSQPTWHLQLVLLIMSRITVVIIAVEGYWGLIFIEDLMRNGLSLQKHTQYAVLSSGNLCQLSILGLIATMWQPINSSFSFYML